MNEVHATSSVEQVQRESTRVRVFTPSGIVEGEYHHPPGIRLSDSLRNAASGERYLLLTDVSIRTLSGGAVADDISAAAFILINTQHASVIVPIGEQ